MLSTATVPPRCPASVRACPRSSRIISVGCEAPDEELDDGDSGHGSAGFDQLLDILGESAIATEPGEGALDARRDPGVGKAPVAAAAASERLVAFDPAAPITTPVVDRSTLADSFFGPLIIDSYDSTVVVPPGWLGTVDAAGSILLEHG